jgi:hypothetical protein
MCDVALAQLIEKTALQKVQNGEIFTAHDITRAVRQQTATRVGHNDVRSEVHSLFSRGMMPNYTRTLATFPGVNPQPWIYHPFTADVSQFQSKIVVQPTQTIASVSNDDDQEDDDHDDAVNKTANGFYRVDARQTLCVPNRLLRKISLTPGQEAAVCADYQNNQLLVVNPQNTGPHQHLSTYTVDSYGNVRITQATLQRGGHPGTEYEIDGDSSRVTIKKHA